MKRLDKNDKTVVIGVCVTQKTLREIDRVAGRRKRSRFVAHLIDNAISTYGSNLQLQRPTQPTQS